MKMHFALLALMTQSLRRHATLDPSVNHGKDRWARLVV
jgi:hypothetical protein